MNCVETFSSDRAVSPMRLGYKNQSQIWSFPSRCVTTYKKNIICQSITQHLFYIHRYIWQGDMFRPSRSSSGPPRKQIQELYVFKLVGHPQALQELYMFQLVGHPQVLQENRSKSLYIFSSITETCKHLGSQNADKLNNSWISFLGGPEENRLGRNMSPWHMYHCIKNKCCVIDWRTVLICKNQFVNVHNTKWHSVGTE